MQTADHELSDSEIEEHFGGLFREFQEALRSDPWTLVQIGERIATARRSQAERRSVPRVYRSPEEKAELRRECIRFRSDGITQSEIASRLGITATLVHRLLADTPA